MYGAIQPHYGMVLSTIPCLIRYESNTQEILDHKLVPLKNGQAEALKSALHSPFIHKHPEFVRFLSLFPKVWHLLYGEFENGRYARPEAITFSATKHRLVNRFHSSPLS